jgi:DNA-binding MarR family transcriptional regulator
VTKPPAKARTAPLSEGARPLEVDVDLGMMRESVSFQLRHASWAAQHAFALQFAASDHVPRQYSVLYLISANPGVSVKALAAAIGVDQSTLVPTLNICEDRGWIRRERGKPDRRVTALVLTDTGRVTLDDLQRLLQAHEDRVTAQLSEAERRQLLDLLRKVRAGALSEN